MKPGWPLLACQTSGAGMDDAVVSVAVVVHGVVVPGVVVRGGDGRLVHPTRGTGPGLLLTTVSHCF